MFNIYHKGEKGSIEGQYRVYGILDDGFVKLILS